MFVKLLLKDGVWFVTDEERPAIVHVHGGIVGHANVARDLRVVEYATEIHHGMVKFQIGEENFSAQVNAVDVRMFLNKRKEKD